MRDPIENISLLQKKINDLQLENQILKNILDRSGISYPDFGEDRQKNGEENTAAGRKCLAAVFLSRWL